MNLVYDSQGNAPNAQQGPSVVGPLCILFDLFGTDLNRGQLAYEEF